MSRGTLQTYSSSIISEFLGEKLGMDLTLSHWLWKDTLVGLLCRGAVDTECVGLCIPARLQVSEVVRRKPFHWSQTVWSAQHHGNMHDLWVLGMTGCDRKEFTFWAWGSWKTRENKQKEKKKINHHIEVKVNCNTSFCSISKCKNQNEEKKKWNKIKHK